MIHERYRTTLRTDSNQVTCGILDTEQNFTLTH